MKLPEGSTRNSLSKRIAFAVVSAFVLLASILALRITDTFQFIHLGVILKAIIRLWPPAG